MNKLTVFMMGSLLVTSLAANGSSESQVRIIGEKSSLPSPLSPQEAILIQKLQEGQDLYKSKYHALAQEMSRRYQIDFVRLSHEYQEKRKELIQKTALLHRMVDLKQRDLKLKELQASFQDPPFQRFLEAYYSFENEMQKDHAFVGGMLARLEEILELVIRQDPLFHYVFESEEFRQRHGLILKRAAWSGDTMKEILAETAPLDVHTVFADPAKAPMLVKVTAGAFHSLAFLRSVLMHELCHIYFYKELAGMEKFMGIAKAPLHPSFSHSSGRMNLLSPSYQYFLIHEYYGFKTQLLFDEKFPEGSIYRLDEAARTHLAKMLDWTFSQLNDRNRNFVGENPIPPVVRWIEKYYG